MRNETALLRLTRARTAMLQSQRFWGSLAIRLKLVERPKLGTMQTDGVHLFYDPEFVLSCSMDKLKGCCAHEVSHVANLHHTRRHGRDIALWNKACDYTINPMLLRAGFQLPEDALNEPAFDGKSAEQIYRLLDAQQSNGDDGDGNEKGGNEAGRSPAGGGAPSDGGNQSQNEQGTGQGEEEPAGSPSDGGAEDGAQTPVPAPGCDPGGCGGVMDAPGSEGGEPSPAEIAQLEASAITAVIQAENFAKQAGQGSSDQERLVEHLKEAQQDWKEELQRYMLAACKSEEDWTRPDRRFIGSGIYLPSEWSEGAGTIAVSVDLSGSTMDWIQDFFTVLSAVKEDVQPERMLIIYHTDRVVAVDEFLKDEELEIKPHGLGGTDFRPVMAWLDEHGEQPDLLMMLTDMEGPWPDEMPAYPVLWACTDEGQGIEAPYGELVTLRR